MDCCSPDGDPRYDRQFDARHAASKLRDYRRNGPAAMTRGLIDGLADGGVAGLTVLDIGGGVGAVHHELLKAGAERAVDVDASRAYLAAAAEEAERQGHAERVRYVGGDLVAVADEVGSADLVALDRVICCYPDMAALVGRSAALARRRYGLVYPRDTWLARVGIAVENAWQRLSGSSFRAYVHRTADVEAILAAQGFVARLRRSGLIWQLAVYERQAA
jgi:SAM-dependent methyltransferase